MERSSNLIKIHADDNVAVVIKEEGLKKGQQIDKNIILTEDIPFAHKVALQDLPKGEKIIRYGTVIGYTSVDITKGSWVHEKVTKLIKPLDLDNLPLATKPKNKSIKAKTYHFLGYKNDDGSVGTRNILGILPTVQCVAGIADRLVQKLKQHYLHLYPNVDDIVALNHNYGCGVAIDAPAAIIPIRTLKNLATNPNLGNELLILGLGCEKLRPETIMPDFLKDKPDSYIYVQDERFLGFEEILSHLMEICKIKLEKLNRRKREICPLSDLKLGLQCGGSDAFSGITANPAIGYATDIIVANGGFVTFSEVTEVRDAINCLTQRAADEKVAMALIEEMKKYDTYLTEGKVDRSANTSPGNKKGGLNNITEKALGSIVKSGSFPIVDVLAAGEKIKKPGLTFHATPASDFICGTLQLASGVNMQLFATGRGTAYNLALAPVVKVSSNSGLARRWHNIIDIDAGIIVSKQAAVKEVGLQILEHIINVASGKQQTCADRLGLYNPLALFNPAPIT